MCSYYASQIADHAYGAIQKFEGFLPHFLRQNTSLLLNINWESVEHLSAKCWNRRAQFASGQIRDTFLILFTCRASTPPPPPLLLHLS